MAKRTKGGTKPHAAKGSNGSGPLTELRELYAFMSENGLQAVEINRKDFHVRLVRRSSPSVPVPVPIMAAGTMPAAQAPSAAPAAPPAAAAPAAPALPPNAHVVKSPMMGIFYRAATPSSPPFAKEGDAVKAGDVLCLIEAMKVFNDIKAEVSGIVRRVCLENGKSVKVGQDLFIIERT